MSTSPEMDEEVSPLERDHSLAVVLPGGQEKSATVHGSKPVMDLLVTLCASYHLNPSDYTVEVLSQNKNNISFKPNSPIGLLDAEKIVLKPKGVEEKIRTPYLPEATVRLLINYNKSHKAVVRVNPRAPLEELLPLVCDKCEFQVESTVLLRDSESEPLDLSKTLNEHGLREVFAKETNALDCTAPQHQRKISQADTAPSKVPSASSFQDLAKKEKKKSENKGFLSLFRRQKKKSESEQAASAPTSPGLTKQRTLSVRTQDAPSPDMPKKRRAPQPPIGVSQSIPNNLSTCHLQGPQRSGENTLRSTKRRAPPPPVANHHQELPTDTTKAAEDTTTTLEEVQECEEPESVKQSSSPPSPLPPQPSPTQPPLRKASDSFRPTIRGKDLSDARSALAKVLTSSVSTGMLVKRLKNSASFIKMHNGTSCMSVNEQCPENATEKESVLHLNLPTENEWEDSVQKKGLTTFKVVPLKKDTDTETTEDVPEQDQAVEEVTPESKSDQSVTEEHSPDQSDSGVPVDCPDQSAQEVETSSHSLPLDNQSSSHLTEVEDTVETPKQNEETSKDDLKEQPQSGNSHEEMTSEGELNVDDQEEVVEISSGQSPTELTTCDSKTCDNQEEEVVQEQEDSFPPPPPPVYFNEDLEDGRQASASCSVSASEPSRPASNGHARSFSEPPSVDKTASAPSRFAQAVALAVQRSRLHSTGKAGGRLIPHDSESTAPSQPRSSYQYGA